MGNQSDTTGRLQSKCVRVLLKQSTKTHSLFDQSVSTGPQMAACSFQPVSPADSPLSTSSTRPTTTWHRRSKLREMLTTCSKKYASKCPFSFSQKSYSHCIKQESGFCCIQYQTCASETNAMSLNAQETTTKVDADCTSDYIGIPGKT